MEVDRTTPGERAWVLAFAEMNSSKVKENGMVLSSEKGNIMRLSDYLISSENMDLLKNLNKEYIDVNRLDSVYIVFGTASKGELKGMGEIKQIINIGRNDVFKDAAGAYYRDLATIIPDANSKEGEFRLDDKIQHEQKAMLKDAVKSKEFDINTIDDLALKIAKGKRLCPKDKEEVRDRTEEAGGKIDEEKFADSQEELQKKLEEQEEGKQLLESSGIEITDDLKKQLTSMGVSLADVKQVTIVKDSKLLSESLGDNGNINPEEETYLISVKNNEANAKGDRMITLQEGRVGDSRGNDDKIRDFKNKYGKDSTVISKTDPEEESISFTDVNGKKQQEVLIGEDSGKIDAIEQEILEIELRVKQQENDINDNKDLTPIQKQEALTQIYGNAYVEIGNLQKENNVDLPNVSDEYLAKANYSVKEEEKLNVEEQVKTTGKVVVAALSTEQLIKYAVDGKIPEIDQEEEKEETGDEGRTIGPKNPERYGF